MKFVAKWRVEGVGDKVREPGDIFDAKPDEVKHLVSVKNGGEVKAEEHAALAPVVKAKEPAAE